MCGVLSIAILKRVKLPRVRLTRAKLGKRAKLSRAKLASRRSGTRPTGPRQTRTRQKGRAKLEWHPLPHLSYYVCMLNDVWNTNVRLYNNRRAIIVVWNLDLF